MLAHMINTQTLEKDKGKIYKSNPKATTFQRKIAALGGTSTGIHVCLHTSTCPCTHTCTCTCIRTCTCTCSYDMDCSCIYMYWYIVHTWKTFWNFSGTPGKNRTVSVIFSRAGMRP